MSTPDHIELLTEGNRVLLVTDDYELFDFLDDYLTSNDVDVDYMSEERRAGRTRYKMYFPEQLAIERVQRLIAKIPRSEIQRIWELNNTQEEAT